MARELALRGCEVVLFEDSSQRPASSVAAGLLQIAGGRISRKHLELRQACWNHYPGFLQSLGLKFRRLPLVRLARGLPGAGAFASTLLGLGIEAKAYPPEELRREYLGSAHGELAGGAVMEVGAVEPRLLLSALRATLSGLGVTFQQRRIVSLGEGKALDENGHRWVGETVILACGAGLPKLWCPDWNFRLEPGEGAEFEGQHTIECAVEAPWLGQLFVPRAGGWRGHGDVAALVGLRGEELWRASAVRAFTPDGLPVVGEVSQGVHVLGGLGRNGLLTAPLFARGLVESLLQEETPPWLRVFAPERSGIGVRRGWSR